MLAFHFCGFGFNVPFPNEAFPSISRTTLFLKPNPVVPQTSPAANLYVALVTLSLSSLLVDLFTVSKTRMSAC
jgi:hypothetical protein